MFPPLPLHQQNHLSTHKAEEFVFALVSSLFQEFLVHPQLALVTGQDPPVGCLK